MSQTTPALMWFRHHDLRLADHPALFAAAQCGMPLICVYIFDETDASRPLGGALKWWLHQALTALRKSLEALNGHLLLLAGDPKEIIPTLVEHYGAQRVFCLVRYQKELRTQDAAVERALRPLHCSFEQSHGTTLRPPHSVMTKSGTSYKVFTAWWHAFQEAGPLAPPLPIPEKLTFGSPGTLDGKIKIFESDKTLLPRNPDWSTGFSTHWDARTTIADEKLEHFLEGPLNAYNSGRNAMGQEGTSRLSPYLCLGVLSPRHVWHACLKHQKSADRQTFLSELGWRDFAWYTLFHEPHLSERNLRPSFDTIAWRNNLNDLQAWQQGVTGIPIVDAAMRQLWHTGWMHNRARMIVGSFLVKHLLIDWREGEKWFWDTLVDADPASNALNWQWVAGTGVDASPFFRIFNPLLQAKKFDSQGHYIRTWVPELAALPNTVLMAPWTASDDTLKAANVQLGITYPKPIVSLADARHRALSAYAAVKAS